MARPMEQVSAWARGCINDEPLEGEVVSDVVVVDRAHAERQAQALTVQIGALIQILLGFSLAMVGITTLVGLVVAPVGFWLIFRGIRQARESTRR